MALLIAACSTSSNKEVDEHGEHEEAGHGEHEEESHEEGAVSLTQQQPLFHIP